MGQTYTKADEGVRLVVASAMGDYHGDLVEAGVRVSTLMVAEYDEESGDVLPTLKHQGYAAGATIKASSLKERALGIGDALLVIDTHTWDALDKAGRVALIDHELEHLQVLLDQGGGGAKVDDLGRPKLKLRLHDWQMGGFTSIARRHGLSAPEVQAVRACRSESGQYCWDFEGAVDEAVDEAVDRFRTAARAAGGATLSAMGREVRVQ